ncbi:MAG: YaiO family outer membrane beta-barrel protein [Gemmatimonadaceae bacterium]
MPHDSVAIRDSARALTTPPWYEAEVGSNVERFSSELGAWQRHSVAVRYRGASESHGVEAIAIRRFDKWNSAVALEGAKNLGRASYVALRAQFAPNADIVARSDLSATLYQSIGTGWELVPSLRVMSFPNERVGIVGLGVGRYSGLWYLSARGNEASQRGEHAFTATAEARRYATDGSLNFLDGVLSLGREVAVLGPNVVKLQQTSSAAIRGQKLLTRNFGISATLSRNAISSLPNRFGAGISTFLRW